MVEGSNDQPNMSAVHFAPKWRWHSCTRTSRSCASPEDLISDDHVWLTCSHLRAALLQFPTVAQPSSARRGTAEQSRCLQAREGALEAELARVRGEGQGAGVREQEATAKAQVLQQRVQQLEEQSGDLEAARKKVEQVTAEKAEVQASEHLLCPPSSPRQTQVGKCESTALEGLGGVRA